MGGCCSVSLSCDQCVNDVTQCLCVHASDIHNIEKNLTALETTMEELRARRDDLSRRVEREENKGLQRLAEIQVWLSRVETIESQINGLFSFRKEELQRLCLCVLCSMNLKLSYCYGRHVFEKLEEVKNLKSNGIFEVIAEPAPTSVVVERPIQSKIVGHEKLLETAWNSLIEDQAGMLGLYGMGGVGKTILLKQINNKIKENGFDGFDVVIWVVVSKDLQILNIQEEVAKKLGLYREDWNRKDEDQKACEIHNVLRRKKFLLLLDDIWEKVDLTKIGIPFPNRETRSKVVFTTRSQEVCGCMGVDIQMEVQCLSFEDALDLFQKKVGEITLGSHPDIPKLVEVVVKKCHGLPLALNKGYEIIGNLVIASDFGKQKDNFIVHAGAGLYEMPKLMNWNAVKRISLMANKIDHISGSRECLQLTTLFLQKKWIKLDNISGEFFKSMSRLVVLDLTSNYNLSKLPDGISELVSLKYLNMSDTSIECLPIGLQELKNLIHLDLEYTLQLSSIVGISALLNLKVLKLYQSGVAYSSKTKEELKILEHLEILTINIDYDTCLDEFLSSHKLMSCTQGLEIKDCQLESSDIWCLASMEKLRELWLRQCTISQIEMDTASIKRKTVSPLQNPNKAFFLSLSTIYIWLCKCPKELTWLMFAPNLTFLYVKGEHELEELINKEKACEGEESGIVPFQKLEYLKLVDLPELKNIYWKPLLFANAFYDK